MDTSVGPLQKQATRYSLEIKLDAKRLLGIFPRTRPVCRALRSKVTQLLREYMISSTGLAVDVDETRDSTWHRCVRVRVVLTNCTDEQHALLMDALSIPPGSIHPRAYRMKPYTQQLSNF